MKYVFVFGLVLCIVKINKCFPHDSAVISKYAKVAVWGNNKTETPVKTERRGSKSGNIWNHRLDPQSISPTTKKKSSSVAYQYPVYQGPESKIDRRIEHVPGIGEVIVNQAQDRFEARPLFAYKNKIAAATYGPPPASQAARTPASPATPAATPAPLAPPPPSANFYNSPYSSYNPPDFKLDDLSSSDLYPPNGPPASNSDSDSIAASTPQKSVSTESTKANTPDLHASLGSPIALYGDHDHDLDYDSQDHHDPPQDPMAMYKYHEGPPNHPPKSLDDIYYPPDFPKDQIADHGGNNGDDMMTDPHDSMMMPPKDQGQMDEGKANNNHAPQDDQMDVGPPPPNDYGHGHAFPQYLYDHHHYDHHVYEEIPHTTMAPEKEDKRVSSTNYSYYYLGRKLWYIPLYFSIYFIIYVTVLILKSIARHKVRLKYKWYEHDTSAKQARSMDLDAIKQEQITDIHHNVSFALKNATVKYNSVIAM